MSNLKTKVNWKKKTSTIQRLDRNQIDLFISTHCAQWVKWRKRIPPISYRSVEWKLKLYAFWHLKLWIVLDCSWCGLLYCMNRRIAISSDLLLEMRLFIYCWQNSGWWRSSLLLRNFLHFCRLPCGRWVQSTKLWVIWFANGAHLAYEIKVLWH